MGKKGTSETPLMRQYNQIKAKHPDALLLFRVGDFYETFGEDAITASKILGIILTARNNGNSKIELAGFPHHSLETYLPKLVRAGLRVAICDQLEDPKTTKKIVKRGVTEVVTPGIAFSDKVLEQKDNNFLCALHFGKKITGVAFLDVSTGEFLISEGDSSHVSNLIQSLQPSEIVFQKQKYKSFLEIAGEQYHSFKLDDWIFTLDYSLESLQKQFSTQSLKGFGIDSMDEAVVAAGSALHYLEQNHQKDLSHVSRINRISNDEFVWMDRFTIRNLELVYSINPDATTLMDVIDFTKTPMGGRMLKRWILMPLTDRKRIEERLNVVDSIQQDMELRENISNELSQMGDMERLLSRAAVGKLSPKETVVLSKALCQVGNLKSLSKEVTNKSLKTLLNSLDACEEICQKIDRTLNEDSPVLTNKGGYIQDGLNKQLDDLRNIRNNGKAYLDEILERESKATDIPSLKIAHNNVFGYYLEVRHTHKDKVPEGWVRKQTLTQAERYITEELKEYEQKILGAEEKILILELQLFNDLLKNILQFIDRIQHSAKLIAELDCLLGFAVGAGKNNYYKPEINDSKVLQIEGGRHPVIEQKLETGEQYISNDTTLDPDVTQVMMITGPNMSGKSAILRQTALIALMAQMGSFVPADKAKIGLVDKVFTRVGASDNISTGESTFMVEMNETASILNNLSERSLILLDEIGRGTSTYDGISIAWSIAEYLHQHPAKAKTLFATHYHELNEMTNTFERIKNYNVSVKEVGNKILFMRKLIEGGSEHSFGIHVAKLAGMPRQVLKRADQILKQLEKSHGSGEMTGRPNGKHNGKTGEEAMQLSFFQLDDPVLSQIRSEIDHLDIDNLTPVEALMKLHEIKKLSGVN